MAKVIKEWGTYRVSIAVEAGKDDANREDTHVHVYKRGRRTQTRIPGNNKDLDREDFEIAQDLFEENYKEISKLYEDVKNGKYDI